MSDPQVNRTTVSGIPTFWAQVPGSFSGALMFRVGRADETLVTLGRTHLVEHLASSDLGQERYEHNAFVEDLRTVFHATGTQSEVLGFLEHIAGALGTLPVGRLEMERDILRSEQDQRPGAVGDALRGYRFGPHTYGLVGYDELGLEWLAPADVSAWCAERFTRANAALWLSGQPPDGFALELADGTRQPVPVPVPLQDVPFPSQAAGPDAGVACSMLGTRGAELSMGIYIADRRLRQQLRYEKGLVYDVGGIYEPMTAEKAEIALSAECRDERVSTVRDAMLDALEELARGGATQEELDREVDQFDRGYVDPESAFPLLDNAAFDELVGYHFEGVDYMRRKLRAVTPETLGASLRSALETLLVVAPEAVDPPARLARYPAGSKVAVTGIELRPPGISLPGRGPRRRLVVGEEGLTLHPDEGPLATILFRDCRACVHVSENERVLWGADGLRAFVDAREWRDGQRAIQAIDRYVPEPVVICEEHGLGRERAREMASASASPASEVRAG